VKVSPQGEYVSEGDFVMKRSPEALRSIDEMIFFCIYPFLVISEKTISLKMDSNDRVLSAL